MSINNNVSYNQVIASWLRDEWQYDFYDAMRSEEHEATVFSDDMSNEAMNRIRRELLYANRSKIMDHIPEDAIWCVTDIKEVDLDRLFLISASWCKALTNGSCKVADVQDLEVLKNIYPNDEKKIIELQRSIHENGFYNKPLIFLASSLESSWTTVEGNHRLVILAKLVKEGKINSVKAYVGIVSNSRLLIG